MPSPIVEIIEPTVTATQLSIGTIPSKKRVAAYARVSTAQDEQMNSYGNQVDYYSKFIQSRQDWEYVGVYADEGISGLGIKKRRGFIQMMEDAISGKIDLILTKSVSRFARNTVDSLTAIRRLKEKGVEVYFEKENIYTLDSKGELLITIMSTLAQEESRSISENVKWGMRKKMAKGQFTMHYANMLGYKKGKDGSPEIDEDQAVIVRRIYKMFLSGATINDIAKGLRKDRIPAPSGKSNRWYASTISSILRNEKYTGNALLQKTYIEDYLTKKSRKNNGALRQYYIHNSHPSIISTEVFDLVQQELSRRSSDKSGRKSNSVFSGKIYCATCGCYCSRRLWTTYKNKSVYAWSCTNKDKKHEKCNMPSIREENIERAFLIAQSKKEGLERNDKNFDPDSFNSAVDRVIIGQDGSLTIEYKDGFKTKIAR